MSRFHAPNGAQLYGCFGSYMAYSDINFHRGGR
jgi:hypothetical protein